MSKNILVINGHSVKKSFCSAIVENYAQGAKESKAKVKILNLYDLKFNPIISSSYKTKKKQVFEKDLKDSQKLISWANHIVVVYPIWWGDMPALMKGFLDRALTPGFAYDPKHKSQGMPKKLLVGKTARVIITMGAPVIFYKLMGQLSTRIMRFNFKYCGIKPAKATHFGSMDSKKTNHKAILVKIRKLGKLLK